jgi:hypothetical protein
MFLVGQIARARRAGLKKRSGSPSVTLRVNKLPHCKGKFTAIQGTSE